MKFIILAVLLIIILIQLSGCKVTPSPPDITGTWELASSVTKDKKVDWPKGNRFRLTFSKGKTFKSFTAYGQKSSFEGSYFTESCENAAFSNLDTVITKSSIPNIDSFSKKEKYLPDHSKFIYTLKNDELTLYRLNSGKRPSSMDNDGSLITMSYRRFKPEYSHLLFKPKELTMPKHMYDTLANQLKNELSLLSDKYSFLKGMKIRSNTMDEDSWLIVSHEHDITGHRPNPKWTEGSDMPSTIPIFGENGIELCLNLNRGQHIKATSWPNFPVKNEFKLDYFIRGTKSDLILKEVEGIVLEIRKKYK